MTYLFSYLFPLSAPVYGCPSMAIPSTLRKEVQARLHETENRRVPSSSLGLGTIERKLEPGAVVTDEQAAGVSNRVKAIAESLTQRDQSKNHYRAIFGELYRRFRITSYKWAPTEPICGRTGVPR